MWTRPSKRRSSKYLFAPVSSPGSSLRMTALPRMEPDCAMVFPQVVGGVPMSRTLAHRCDNRPSDAARRGRPGPAAGAAACCAGGPAAGRPYRWAAMRPVRLLHTSDLHIAGGFSTPAGCGRRDDCLCPLLSVADLAVRHEVDALLVVGDLFDHGRVDPELVGEAFDVLAGLPVPTVLIAGNHDVHDDAGLYRRFCHVVGGAGVTFLDQPGGLDDDDPRRGGDAVGSGHGRPPPRLPAAARRAARPPRGLVRRAGPRPSRGRRAARAVDALVADHRRRHRRHRRRLRGARATGTR